MSGVTDEGGNQPKADKTSDDTTPQLPADTQPVIERVEGEYRTQPPEENTQPAADPPKRLITPEWAHVIVSSVLVVVTTFVLCVYCGQLKQMKVAATAATNAADRAKDSIDQVERNAHLDQRAWVTIKIMRLLEYPTLDKEVPIEIIFIDTGKTPALSVGVATRCFTGMTSTGILEEYLTVNPTNREVSRAIIGPNVEFSSIVRNPVVIQNKQQIDDLEDGFLTLYVVGFVEYSDVFEKVHHTRFAFRISGKKQLDKTFFEACEIGNKAD